MIEGTTLESMPALKGQMSINDFLPAALAITPVEIREPTDLEVAAFFESTDS
ncbi:hypothetical protein OHC50_04315 [Paenarthrobacter ilicis]|uniref:hypothetical protein n=1 Tax=Paenarthrobacter ilicis TaxID=43665 RepID=UPI00300A7D22